MTREPGKTSAAAIRAKLLALAQVSGEDYQRVLGRFAIERLLYRLGNSPHRDRFVLKGATLFTLWTGKSHRPTKDLDLLGSGSSAIEDVEQSVRAICEIEDDDGISFDGQSVEGVRIQEDDEYDGVRVKFRARLAGARIPMQVDIGFGDAVYPEPSFAEFPVLLAMSAPVIRAYPREASIAEKLHAMVDLDIRNSRMKDFYDIWFMANTWDFEQRLLHSAIAFSFERRRMALPRDVPFALTEEFLSDPQKTKQWKAFLERLGSRKEAALSLVEVGEMLRAFLLPCLLPPTDSALAHWTPNVGWGDHAQGE
jgi:predicted nucleotidyltransferase component of viral defense system